MPKKTNKMTQEQISKINSENGKQGGRPSKLTEDVLQDILSYIKVGSYIETAAAAAGISKQSLYYWLKRGAKAREELAKGVDIGDGYRYIRFSDSVKKGLAQAEIRDVSLIAKAAQTNWTAAAWRLERKFPDRWGQKGRFEMTHSGRVEHEVKFSKEDKEHLMKQMSEFIPGIERVIGGDDNESESEDS